MATRTFAQDIEAFTRVTQIHADFVLRRLTFEALFGLMWRSPVDTGRFRASWRVGVNKIDDSVEARRADKDSSPQGSVPQANLERENTKAASARFGDTIHITNSLPYADALEKGHSKQHPTGVLNDTFQELSLNLKFAVMEALSRA